MLAKRGQPPVVDKEVNMIRGAGPAIMPMAAGLGTMNPILAGIMATATIPKFSGRDEEWYDFKREWERYLTVLQESVGPGQDIPDAMKLQLLQGYLEDVPHYQLRAMLDKNPGLTYGEFWKELQKVYGRDLIDRHRREWENLSLRHLPELSLHSLRTFQAQFEMCMARVGSVTESEAATRFVGALPLKHQ